MKRIYAVLFLAAVLSGCGSKTAAKAYDTNIEYTVSMPDDHQDTIYKYDLLEAGRMLEKGADKEDIMSIRHMVSDPEKFFRDAENIDAAAELSKLDNITDEVFYNSPTDTEIYSFAPDDSFMLFENEAGYLELIGETFLNVKEYDDLKNDICQKSGLIYNGARLGKAYNKGSDTDKKRFAEYAAEDMVYTDDSLYSAFEYTGRNCIAFANREFLIYNSSIIHIGNDERIFADLPLRAVFYMDGSSTKYIYIYWMSGNAAPIMTENNLRELHLTDEIGNTAADLAQDLFDSVHREDGIKNGIKYSYRPNITKGRQDLRCSVLVLELE